MISGPTLCSMTSLVLFFGESRNGLKIFQKLMGLSRETLRDLKCSAAPFLCKLTVRFICLRHRLQSAIVCRNVFLCVSLGADDSGRFWFTYFSYCQGRMFIKDVAVHTFPGPEYVDCVVVNISNI